MFFVEFGMVSAYLSSIMKKLCSWVFLTGCLFITATSLAQRGYDTLPNLPDYYNQRLAKFRLEKETHGHIMFLGNSITEGGNWRRLLADSSVINRGISGDNTFGVLKRFDEFIRFKPSKIFILIGVNDLSKNIPTDATIENIFHLVTLIQKASPKTRIYVQSILPINPAVQKFPKQFGKAAGITAINQQLEKYAKALKYEFIDIHHHFTDKQEALEAKYTYDGLHLNKAGYEHWVQFLKKNKWL